MRPSFRFSPQPEAAITLAPDTDMPPKADGEHVHDSTMWSSSYQFPHFDLESLYLAQRDARKVNDGVEWHPWDNEVFDIEGAFVMPEWLQKAVESHPSASGTATSPTGTQPNSDMMNVEAASTFSSSLSSLPLSSASRSSSPIPPQQADSTRSMQVDGDSYRSSSLSSLPASMQSSPASLRSAVSSAFSIGASLASSAKSLASFTAGVMKSATTSARAGLVGSTVAHDVLRAVGLRPASQTIEPQGAPHISDSALSLPKNAQAKVAKNTTRRKKLTKNGKKSGRRGKREKKSQQAKSILLGGNKAVVVMPDKPKKSRKRPSKSGGARLQRLWKSFRARAYKVSLALFDFATVPIAKSGFMGVRKRMKSPIGWSAAKLAGHLKTFQRFAFDGRPLILMDAHNRIFCIRSSIPPFMADLHDEIVHVLEWFTDKVPSMPHGMNVVRGYFNYYLFGVQCQYSPTPQPTAFHTKHQKVFEELMNKTIPGGDERPPMQRLVGFVNSVLQCFAPEVYDRMMAIPTFGHPRPFGVFHLMCINAPGKIVQWVHTHFHIDWKNCPFFCAVYTYCTGPFDHRRKAWLCLWEAGVLIELPPGCVCLYPSALFAHFNVNLCDIEVRWTLEQEDGTLQWDQEYTGRRGSIVFFTQASMMQRAEHNMTLTAARKAGLEVPSYKVPAGRIVENLKLFTADSGLAAAIYPIPAEVDIFSQM